MTTHKSYNALLVYPAFPPSFWAQNYFLEMVDKKGGMPPLGLMTVAAMLPDHYHLKLVDMNVEELTDDHLEWADVVFTSTMIVQRLSLAEVVERCNRLGVPVVAGGPHPTSNHDDIEGVDHFVLDEVEESFAGFLADFEAGVAKRIYRTPERPSLTKAPIPRYDLIDMNIYGTMAVQFSRGCPFTCEFCDIPALFGRAARTKSNEQMLREFDALLEAGWRGPVFLVDDNFIGNKRDALRLLPAVAEWQRAHGYPFVLVTEASVNMVEMEPLMDAMIAANFAMVFLGIESPNPEALELTKKGQNIKRGADNYLLRAVRTLQGKGMEVTGGFILGLDGDGVEVFDAQIDFIQQAGIPVAMVGLLSALKGTPLYERLERAGRLHRRAADSELIDINYRPELGEEVLIDGYKRVLSTLYQPSLSNYFERCWTMLEQLGSSAKPRAAASDNGARPRLSWSDRVQRWKWRVKRQRRSLRILSRSFRRQALSRQGPAYLKFLGKTLLYKRHMFQRALRLAMQGYHFEKVTQEIVQEHVLVAGDYGFSVLEDDHVVQIGKREIA